MNFYYYGSMGSEGVSALGEELSGLSGVTVTVERNSAGVVGGVDTFGNFYYFRSRNLESLYPVGSRVNVASSELSPTNPYTPVPGMAPWTLPGFVPSGGTHTTEAQRKRHRLYTYAGIAAAGILGLLFLPKLFKSTSTVRSTASPPVLAPPPPMVLPHYQLPAPVNSLPTMLI